jgi:nicotinamidase-related amidase
MKYFNQNYIFSLILFISFNSFAIEPRKGDNFALVIIDMQPQFVTRGGDDKLPKNIKKVDDIIARQIEMIKLAEKQKIPIVFIEYENFGNTNSKLKEASKAYKNVKYFTKDTDGMFSSSNKSVDQISEYFRGKGIGNLIITGANGGACVNESIYGALDNNYNVLAYSKGIADFNYTDFIYPYDDIYDFKPKCQKCSFKEVDEFETISLALTAKKAQAAKPKELKIDDSNREAGVKHDVPTYPIYPKKGPQPAEVYNQ